MTDRHKYSYDVDLADANTAATKVIRFVGARKRVLEVGAGPGSISRVLKQRFGCHVTAVELDAAAVNELETFCDRVYRLDLNAPGWVAALAEETPFEFVIAADVLEHLVDPLAALRSLTSLLAAEGHVIVSLPNATHSALLATLLEGDFRYGDWGLLDRTHVRFFGPRNVETLLAASDLEVVAQEYVTRHPSQTEFADCWQRLDAEQRALLARRPDGNIYQIVVKARPRRAASAAQAPDAATLRDEAATETGAAAGGATAIRAPVDPQPGASLAELMLAASACQDGGDLERARRLFLRAMAEYGENFDALHMLGVIDLERDDPRRAMESLQRALPLLQADFPPYFRNLGLCLAALQRSIPPVRRHPTLAEPQDALRIRRGIDLPPLPAATPLVSVVVATTPAGRSTGDTIASIREQSYPNIEVIVATEDVDGADIARSLAASCPLRIVHPQSGQAGARLNQCIAEARGHYVALVDGGDHFAPPRIAHAVRALTGCRARWGFSNIACIDERSRALGFGERPDVDAAMRAHEALFSRLTLSEGLMHDSVLVDGGNLFFERSLWQEAGGFGAVRFHVNWLFALSVSILAEPVYLDEPDYVRQFGIDAPDAGAADARAGEENLIRERWLNHLDAARHLPNRLLEQAKHLRRQQDFAIMGNGGGHLLDRARLLRYLQEMRNDLLSREQRAR